jgi:hypothetical protein
VDVKETSESDLARQEDERVESLLAQGAVEKSEESEPLPKEGEEKPNPFQLLTLDELFDQQETPFLVQDLLMEEAHVVLYGLPKTGKTFLLLDLCAVLAKGHGYFAQHFHVNGPRRVLYASMEGRSGLRNRFHAAVINQELDQESMARIRFVPLQPDLYNNTDDRSAEAFAEASSEFKPEVVVLDTLMLSSPGANLSDQQDMSQIFANAERLRTFCKEQTGIRPVLIHGHHANKEGSLFGSVGLPAHMDVVLKVEKDHLTGISTLTAEAMKDGEGFEPLAFRVFHPDAAQPRSAAVEWIGTKQQSRQDYKLLAIQEQVLKALKTLKATKENPQTAAQIKGAIEGDIGPKKLKEALGVLREKPGVVIDGVLTKTPQSGNQECWHYYLDERV